MNTPIPSCGASGVLWVAAAFVLGLVGGVVGDRVLAPEPAAPSVPVVEAKAAPETEKARKPRRERKVREEAKPVEAQVAEAVPAEAEKPAEAQPQIRPPRFGGMRLPSPAQIAAFKAMWTAGQEQTYAKVSESFGLEEDGLSRLKEVVADMNAHLAETVDAFAALLREQEGTGIEATPELQVRAFGEFANILSSTYDSIGDLMPEDRRNDVQKIELVRLISPNAFDPVVDVMRERMGDK